MFRADYVHISRLRKSWLLHLSLNICHVWTLPTYEKEKLRNVFIFFEGAEGGRNREREDTDFPPSQGSRSRAQQYMETVLMSESLVVSSDVEEIVTEVVPSRVEETVTVISCSITRTKTLSPLHTCLTCKNTVSPRNGWLLLRFQGR
jgi:hypothetical protein